MIKSVRTKLTGNVACVGAKRHTFRSLLGIKEGKRPLGRLRRRWEDNFKTDLREIEWGGMDWIDLTQDRDQ
jgi:hypothetical protein